MSSNFALYTTRSDADIVFIVRSPFSVVTKASLRRLDSFRRAGPTALGCSGSSPGLGFLVGRD